MHLQELMRSFIRSSFLSFIQLFRHVVIRSHDQAMSKSVQFVYSYASCVAIQCLDNVTTAILVSQNNETVAMFGV